MVVDVVDGCDVADIVQCPVVVEGAVERQGKVSDVVAADVLGCYNYYDAGSLVYAEFAADDVLGAAGLGVFGIEGCFRVDDDLLDLEDGGDAYG
ncbi:MAG TPA: hypothetical protein VIH83_01865 [Candidatus Bathyarchaeia archaeon]